MVHLLQLNVQSPRFLKDDELLSLSKLIFTKQLIDLEDRLKDAPNSEIIQKIRNSCQVNKLEFNRIKEIGKQT